VETTSGVGLSAWFFDRRHQRLAWILWSLVFLAFSVLSVLRPGMRTVLHVYRSASNAWLSGHGIYPEIDYPLPFVILFTPFARIPLAASQILWRALEMGVYVSSLWRLARVVEPGPRRLFLLVSALAMPAAFGSIKNGQTNLLLAGAMAHAAVDWITARRRATVVWLIVAVIVKPIGLVMVLLLAATDLALIPWLAGGLLLTAALPLLFDPWPYVVAQYRAWVADLLSIAPSGEHRFDDINGLLRTLDVHVPTQWMLLVRAAAGALTLAVWWVAAKRLGEPQRGLTLLGLSAAYLMLFNPRTESNSYVILSHSIAALALLVLVVQRRRIGWLLVGLDVAMANGMSGKTIWLMTRLWLMPVLAAVFFAFLVFEVLSARSRSAAPPTSGRLASTGIARQ
jgi:alpha-1,2-mannosyltransferase